MEISTTGDGPKGEGKPAYWFGLVNRDKLLEPSNRPGAVSSDSGIWAKVKLLFSPKKLTAAWVAWKLPSSLFDAFSFDHGMIR